MCALMGGDTQGQLSKKAGQQGGGTREGNKSKTRALGGQRRLAHPFARRARSPCRNHSLQQPATRRQPRPHTCRPASRRCGSDRLHANGGRRRVDVADAERGGEQAEHQEGLRAGLVLDVVLDGVDQQVLRLEEHLMGLNSGECRMCECVCGGGDMPTLKLMGSTSRYLAWKNICWVWRGEGAAGMMR